MRCLPRTAALALCLAPLGLAEAQAPQRPPQPTSPGTQQPAPTRPVLTQPTLTRPTLTQPVLTQPTPTRPVLTQPAPTQLTPTQPSVNPSTSSPRQPHAPIQPGNIGQPGRTRQPDDMTPNPFPERGLDIFDDPALQQRLNLTPEQGRRVSQLRELAQREAQAIEKIGQTNPTEAVRRYVTWRRGWQRELDRILTDQQMQIWSEFSGQPVLDMNFATPGSRR